jgi:hypothetical protein
VRSCTAVHPRLAAELFKGKKKMSTTRRFCLAPAFARLVKRERMAIPIIEGHFPDQSERRSFVRLEGDHCVLMLEDRDAEGASEEERSEVSRAQGEVLLDVCAGKVVFERIALDAPNGVKIHIDRFTSPVAASFVEIVFADPTAASAFRPPIWMGAELGAEDVGDPRRIALGGKPKLFEGPIHNAALESLLDLLDHRTPRYGTYRSGGEDPMMNALRRLVKQPGEGGEPERNGSAKPASDAGIVMIDDTSMPGKNTLPAPKPAPLPAARPSAAQAGKPRA